jgi:hypothetical protein
MANRPKSERKPASGSSPPDGGQLGSDDYHIWKPRPLVRSVSWKPTPEGHEEAAASSYDVFMDQRVFEAMHQHVWNASPEEEPFGYLVGDLCEDRESNRRYVIVKAAIPSHVPFRENEREQITRDVAEALQSDVARRRGVLAGWYHRHREGPVELTKTDASTHERLFPEPWQVAFLFVTDHADSTGGCFLRTRDGFAADHALPFYEIVRLESLKAKGLRSSRVDWSNVTTDDSVIVEALPRPAPPAVVEPPAAVERPVVEEAPAAEEPKIAEEPEEVELDDVLAEAEVADEPKSAEVTEAPRAGEEPETVEESKAADEPETIEETELAEAADVSAESDEGSADTVEPDIVVVFDSLVAGEDDSESSEGREPEDAVAAEATEPFELTEPDTAEEPVLRAARSRLAGISARKRPGIRWSLPALWIGKVGARALSGATALAGTLADRARESVSRPRRSVVPVQSPLSVRAVDSESEPEFEPLLQAEYGPAREPELEPLLQAEYEPAEPESEPLLEAEYEPSEPEPEPASEALAKAEPAISALTASDTGPESGFLFEAESLWGANDETEEELPGSEPDSAVVAEAPAEVEPAGSEPRAEVDERPASQALVADFPDEHVPTWDSAEAEEDSWRGPRIVIEEEAPVSEPAAPREPVADVEPAADREPAADAVPLREDLAARADVADDAGEPAPATVTVTLTPEHFQPHDDNGGRLASLAAEPSRLPEPVEAPAASGVAASHTTRRDEPWRQERTRLRGILETSAELLLAAAALAAVAVGARPLLIAGPTVLASPAAAEAAQLAAAAPERPALPEPRQVAVAQTVAPRGPLSDSDLALRAAIGRYKEVAGVFESGRLACGQLRAAYVAVDDRWVAYGAERRAKFGDQWPAEVADRDETLREGVREVEDSFTHSGCFRP